MSIRIGKGRPSVGLAVVGTAETREDLIVLQDADIAKIQADDIKADNEIARDEAEDGEIPELITEWANDYQWEMARTNPDDLRTLCGRFDDGTTWSNTYHILTGIVGVA